MSEFYLVCLTAFLVATVAFCQYPSKPAIALLEEFHDKCSLLGITNGESDLEIVVGNLIKNALNKLLIIDNEIPRAGILSMKNATVRVKCTDTVQLNGQFDCSTLISNLYLDYYAFTALPSLKSCENCLNIGTLEMIVPVDVLGDNVLMINWINEITLSSNRSHSNIRSEFHTYMGAMQAIVAFLKDYYCVLDLKQVTT
ncbi:hypothetical protein Aperf_G00000003559 [Anoplocephala perfoliata]